MWTRTFRRGCCALLSCWETLLPRRHVRRPAITRRAPVSINMVRSGGASSANKVTNWAQSPQWWSGVAAGQPWLRLRPDSVRAGGSQPRDDVSRLPAQGDGEPGSEPAQESRGCRPVRAGSVCLRSKATSLKPKGIRMTKHTNWSASDAAGIAFRRHSTMYHGGGATWRTLAWRDLNRPTAMGARPAVS